MEFSIYSPEISTSSSRIVQESINIGQGVSAYGMLAAFLDNNIANIDLLAEYIGDLAAQKRVRSTYDKQHFDNNSKYRTFLNRNIYLNKEKVDSMQEDRFITGFLVRTAAEAAIKYGARAIGKWANQKDIFITCEQLYSILVAYICNAKKGANVNRAKIELNKIRNTFPLNKLDRIKIAEKYNTGTFSLDRIETSSILTKSNESVRNALAFYLTSLSRHLYGAESSSDKSVLDMYSLIELNGHYGKELNNENEYQYDTIAADQTAYLQISRGIMKNMFKDSPHIDLGKINARSQELAQYDPYSIRRKKIKGTAKGGALTIGGIITSNPEIALSGLATALSQFTQSDEVLQLSKDAMKKWGIGGNEFDLITDDSSSILSKSSESDLSNKNIQN